MKTVLGFLVVVLACACVKCDDLILGNLSSNYEIFHHDTAYIAIPFIKREKDIFFYSPNHEVIVKILAYDLLHSGAKAIVTAGGIGQTYVNIRLTSERGMGLYYEIRIYAQYEPLEIQTVKQQTDVQKADIPQTDVQKSAVQKADLQQTDVQKANIQQTDVQISDIQKTDI